MEITLIQGACAMIGDDAPQSVDDVLGDDNWSLPYRSRVPFCFSIHPFGFARELRQLSERADLPSPVEAYRHVYEFPTDVLGPPDVILDTLDPHRAPYERWGWIGPYIVSDRAPLYARFQVMPPLARWPNDFRHAVTLALAGDYALSRANDKTLRDQLHQEAFGTPSQEYRGGAMAVAIKSDLRSKPPQRLATGTDILSRARFMR